jgi:hypothetical protein
MECPCRRCRRLFWPKEASLRRGSPYWWYCPACQSAQRWVERQDALRTQLTVALGRAHLLRRRLSQGCAPARVAADLDVLERA